jgi:hypothetical protein
MGTKIKLQFLSVNNRLGEQDLTYIYVMFDLNCNIGFRNIKNILCTKYGGKRRHGFSSLNNGYW